MGFLKWHWEKNTLSVPHRLVSHHVIPTLNGEWWNVRACGYYKTRSFIPSIWRWICVTRRVWFIRENRQTARPRAYKCCLAACFTLPLISQIRLRLSTIQLSELFIYKCMHTCQQQPWLWVCTKKKIGRHWKNWLGRPSRSRGIKGGVTIVPVCHQSRPSLYKWGL